MFNRFNNSFNSQYSSDHRITVQNQQSLQQVIDKGINMMSSPHLSEELFQIWQDYATSILNIISPSAKKYISIDYATFNLALISSNISPFEKFNRSIRFLMSLYPLL